jgi:ribose 5-phosphate isomerase B
MKIAIGCDEAAYALKEEIKTYLAEQTAVPVEVEDFGVHSTDPVDYPDIAVKVAAAVAAQRFERGILLCGTGIGMAITANKVRGIRAALCHDAYSAERAQKSNDAQILTMGARVIGPELAKKVVEAWLRSHFAGGPSARKVQKIMQIQDAYLQTAGAGQEHAPSQGSASSPELTPGT